MSHQDWTPVVLNKKKGGKARGDAAVAQGKRSGQNVSTSKKYGAGGNKQRSGPANAAKIDAEGDVVAVKKVSHDLKVRIQQARQAKGWNQKQLAQAINEKQTVVQDYESGRAVPNNQVLTKMERALGAKLRGKKR